MKKKRKAWKIVLIVLVCIIVGIVIGGSIYVYQCTHYWQNDLANTMDAGFQERNATMPDGSVIHYAEGPANGDALLLIHGQTGAWQDYARVLPRLSQNWHVFAVDCYGHGQSTHGAEKYTLKQNGDDLIHFINQVINKPTIVSGHSSGGLLASYVAAYGGALVKGAVLEDPPVFSTEADNFARTFAYLDTYKPMHEYGLSDQAECWEAYYLRHCLWGQIYMASSMPGIANYAQMYHENHPNEPVQIAFMPESVNYPFLYTQMYDHAFGERFYDYSWHSSIPHETLMANIKVPTQYLHIEEMYTDDGILMAAASNEQAKRAAELIGDCTLVELSGNHNIHRFQPDEFIRAFEAFQ